MSEEPAHWLHRRDGIVCRACECPIPDHTDWGCRCGGCYLNLDKLTPVPDDPTVMGYRILPDGRWAVLYELLFGYRILIGPLIDWNIGGDDTFDYEKLFTLSEMIVTFETWDGYGDPPDWYRKQNAETIRTRDQRGGDEWVRRPMQNA